MVKKPTTPKSSGKSSGKKAAGKAGAKAAGDPRRQVIDAAFVLALEHGWRDLSLAEIAEAAGL
ncbi:MAG: hypothetical protein RLN99_01975, partial [Kiloniellaceae bacterium]